MTEKKLNARQRKFVSGVLKGKSKTQAAIDAGYSEKTAPRNTNKIMKNYEVQKAIEKGQARRSERLEMEEDFELIHAKKLAEVCEQHLIGEDGVLNSGAAQVLNQSLNTIGKLRGKFVSKIQVGLSDGFSEALESVDADN